MCTKFPIGRIDFTEPKQHLLYIVRGGSNAPTSAHAREGPRKVGSNALEPMRMRIYDVTSEGPTHWGPHVPTRKVRVQWKGRSRVPTGPGKGGGGSNTPTSAHGRKGGYSFLGGHMSPFLGGSHVLTSCDHDFEIS